ncbi:MAG TPA: tetratricopeptide repeat protein [Acetobacteraceae bacterium]|jgi:TolA-binding protein|nr:tetratricopeptide repeat protein [Acetobacteraceae bacterium]
MTIRVLLAAALLLFAVPLFGSWPARAQIESREAIALRDQILQVQQEVDQLRSQIQSGGGNQGSALGGNYSQAPSAPNGDLVASLLQQVSSLQDQVRELRGEVDDLSHRVDQQVADIGKKVDDLAFQFQLVQGKGSAAGGLIAPAPRAATPVAAAPVPPEVILRQGEAALARADYTGAANAAETVLRADAHSPRAYDAQFLLAQALFGQRQYTRAALAYDDTFNRSPGGSRAQDSLLGLARSLAAIDQKPAACAALSKLRQQFATSLRPDIAQSAASLSRQTSCS